MKTKAEKERRKNWLKTPNGKEYKRKAQQKYRKNKKEKKHYIEYYI